MTVPTTFPLSAEHIAGIRSTVQATRWFAFSAELRQFRAYCCDIDADATMGVTKPPTVMIDISPNPVCLGETVTWDFAGSYAPSQTITTYNIDMGDGHSYSGAAASGSHTYAATGTYHVVASVVSDATPPKTMTITHEVSVIDCDDPDPDPDPPDPTPPGPPVPPAPVPPVYLSGRLLAFDKTLGCHQQLMTGAWAPRNTGVVDVHDNQGGYDPWWQVEQNSLATADAILWRVQDGAIYRSIDDGLNWAAATGMGDPPNTWADTPAPTFAACEVLVRTDNLYRSGEHYFLVRWYNGAAWRGWVLKCAGNGAIWTWGALGSEANAIPADVIWDFNDGPQGWVAYHHEIWGDTSTCGNTKKWVSSPIDNHRTCAIRRTCKMSGTDISILGGASTTVAGRGIQIQVSDDMITWANLYLETPATYGCDIARGPGIGAFTNKYIWVGYYGPLPVSNGILNVKQITIFGATFSGCAPYPIWMDTDTASGAYLYVTIWRSDGILMLQKLLTQDLSIISETILGAATISDVIAKTYIAYPRVKEFDSDTIYVYGRMNAPDGMVGIQHVIKSIDGGVDFVTSVENSWGADTCGVFEASDVGGKINAIRNQGGTVPIFYHGIGTLDLVNTIPLTGDVLPDAFTGTTGLMAAGAGSTVVVTGSDGVSWTIQTGYPPGGDIRTLLYV